MNNVVVYTHLYMTEHKNLQFVFSLMEVDPEHHFSNACCSLEKGIM